MAAASDSLQPKLAYFAVCDDIRSEEYGKITLIGYYGRSIRIGTLPALLPKLCYLAQFEILPPGTKLQLTLLSPSGVTLMSAAELQVPTSDPASALIPDEYKYTQLVFQLIPMLLSEEGPYRVDFTFPNGTNVHASFYVASDPSLVKKPDGDKPVAAPRPEQGKN